MNSNSLEIERRFLILRPPEPELAARCSHVYHMEQTYLLSPPHQTERVRRRAPIASTRNDLFADMNPAR